VEHRSGVTREVPPRCQGLRARRVVDLTRPSPMINSTPEALYLVECTFTRSSTICRFRCCFNLQSHYVLKRRFSSVVAHESLEKSRLHVCSGWIDRCDDMRDNTSQTERRHQRDYTRVKVAVPRTRCSTRGRWARRGYERFLGAVDLAPSREAYGTGRRAQCSSCLVPIDGHRDAARCRC
jgi:hypothetical protein